MATATSFADDDDDDDGTIISVVAGDDASALAAADFAERSSPAAPQESVCQFEWCEGQGGGETCGWAAISFGVRRGGGDAVVRGARGRPAAAVARVVGFGPDVWGVPVAWV